MTDSVPNAAPTTEQDGEPDGVCGAPTAPFVWFDPTRPDGGGGGSDAAGQGRGGGHGRGGGRHRPGSTGAVGRWRVRSSRREEPTPPGYAPSSPSYEDVAATTEVYAKLFDELPEPYSASAIASDTAGHPLVRPSDTAGHQLGRPSDTTAPLSPAASVGLAPLVAAEPPNPAEPPHSAEPLNSAESPNLVESQNPAEPSDLAEPLLPPPAAPSSSPGAPPQLPPMPASPATSGAGTRRPSPYSRRDRRRNSGNSPLIPRDGTSAGTDAPQAATVKAAGRSKPHDVSMPGRGSVGVDRESCHDDSFQTCPVCQPLIEPTLAERALVEPALIEPALIEPALIERALIEPAFAEPALIEPALVERALVEPAFAERAPLADVAVGRARPQQPAQIAQWPDSYLIDDEPLLLGHGVQQATYPVNLDTTALPVLPVDPPSHTGPGRSEFEADPVVPAEPTAPHESAALGEPAALDAQTALDEPAALGEPAGPGEPAALDGPAAFDEFDEPADLDEPAAFGEPANLGRPADPAEPANLGEPADRGEPEDPADSPYRDGFEDTSTAAATTARAVPIPLSADPIRPLLSSQYSTGKGRGVLTAPSPRQGNPRKPVAPKRPITGLAAMVLIALLSAFFAWVSAEPFWLSVGRSSAGVATVTHCTGSGIQRRCQASFASLDGEPIASRIPLLGGDSTKLTAGVKVPARMVGRKGHAAYATGNRGLQAIWMVGFIMIILCGLVLAWAGGATRLPSRRARTAALLASLGAPIALLLAMIMVAG